MSESDVTNAEKIKLLLKNSIKEEDLIKYLESNKHRLDWYILLDVIKEINKSKYSQYNECESYLNLYLLQNIKNKVEI